MFHGLLRFLTTHSAPWACIAALLVASCGDDIQTLVVVDYVGVSSDASGLFLLKILDEPDGQQTKDILNMGTAVPASIGKFAFRLPVGERGKLTVRIGVDKPGWTCLGGLGESPPIQLAGQPQVNVFLSITDYPQDGPPCL